MLVFSSTFCIHDSLKARGKDVLEHNLAHYALLVHVFFNELDEELVNLGLKLSWNVDQVAWLHHFNDDIEGLAVSNNRFFSLRIKLNHLAQDNNYVIIDGRTEDHPADAWSVQNFEEAFHGFLIPLLSYFLGELLRFDDKHLDKPEYIKQYYLFFRVEIFQDHKKAFLC